MSVAMQLQMTWITSPYMLVPVGQLMKHGIIYIVIDTGVELKK